MKMPDIEPKNGETDVAKNIVAQSKERGICFVVPVHIMAAVLEVLQDELPMKKARAVVQALEQCPKKEFSQDEFA